jgi:DNA-directed RNA polymerase subunit H (RpoH/RPB5)
MAKEKKAVEKEIDVFQSSLVPKHEIVNAEEKEELLKKLSIRLKQLPRMKRSDAIAKILGAKRGDVVRIARNSQVASEYYYYRVVM